MVAHELGHGQWKLLHSFDGCFGEEVAATRGKTDNLMDYNDGTHLAKWQWDIMQEPAIFDGFLYSDEDKMAAADKKGKEVVIEDRIKWALDSVAKYAGKIYKQETGTLRTGITTEALQYMDCTEFAARFVQLACNLKQIPSFSTAILAPIADVGGTYGNCLQFVIGSNEETFTDIRPGDIFLWRQETGGGHVGVVESYNEPYVYILEALTTGCESSLNNGACSNCVRRSKYTRTGNALQSHKGWKGYFRPIIDN